MSRLSSSAESGFSGALGGDVRAGERLLGSTGSWTGTDMKTPDSILTALLLPPQPGPVSRLLFPVQQRPFLSGRQDNRQGKKPALPHLVSGGRGVTGRVSPHLAPS